MNQDFYNDDKEFKEVIDLLKKMPRIKTEDNFEYNLMTRIQNKKFSSKTLKSEKYTIFSFLKPALAVSISAVIIFFIVDYQSSEIDNPFLTKPEIRKAAAEENYKETPQEFVITEKRADYREPNSALKNMAVNEENSAKRVVLAENDVLTEETMEFPFPDKSFNLDKMLNSGSNETSARNDRILAGAKSGDFMDSATERILFEGFYTKLALSKKMRDSLRGLNSQQMPNKDADSAVIK